VMYSDVDPWLTQLGVVPERAIDLVRLAVGAYITDRLVGRSSASWSRDLELIVHVRQPDAILGVVPIIETTLYWLSGDTWALRLVEEQQEKAPLLLNTKAPTVNLLSGGVDSLCGAFLSAPGTVFMGHSDNPSVRQSQNRVRPYLSNMRDPFVYHQVQVGAAANATRERSTRTRSFMFTALGIAVAAAGGANQVTIPENGFTSLNPPLSANRGGPHSTRSTHPTTFAYINAMCQGLGFDISVANPYLDITKGQLVRMAADSLGHDVVENAVPITLSCSKGFGQYFRGGAANLNCGACIACMTRRGSILSAGLADRTEYLVNRLVGTERQRLLDQRRSDISAVRSAGGWEFDPATLAAMGPFPEGFDMDAARALLELGVEELVRGLP